MLFEGDEFLLFAIFEEAELVARNTVDGVLTVADQDIDEDERGGALEDGRRRGLRWRELTLRAVASSVRENWAHDDWARSGMTPTHRRLARMTANLAEGT